MTSGGQDKMEDNVVALMKAEREVNDKVKAALKNK